jgi:Co/Zn/Cd efflux system component
MRLRNDWNVTGQTRFFPAKVITEEVMYIGLGGLLILILVLWLLGVI